MKENREIKFRLWYTDKDKMFYDNDGVKDYQDGWYISEVGIVNYMFSVTEYKWMQYTGLKDKNGVEIYEGDIIKSLIDYEDFVWEVAFDYDRDFAGWSITPQNAEDGEVIGNIYENPDLLT